MAYIVLQIIMRHFWLLSYVAEGNLKLCNPFPNLTLAYYLICKQTYIDLIVAENKRIRFLFTIDGNSWNYVFKYGMQFSKYLLRYPSLPYIFLQYFGSAEKFHDVYLRKDFLIVFIFWKSFYLLGVILERSSELVTHIYNIPM